MKLELLITPDCPHATEAMAQLRQVLDAMGLYDTPFDLVVIRTLAQAAAADFHGSPGYHLDGHDLFPTPTAPTLQCRTYANSTAPGPGLYQLRETLQFAQPLLKPPPPGF